MALVRSTDTNKIEDFGEKIGGARKDMWSNRHFTLEDLEKLDEREYAEIVKKPLIWNEPDYKKMVEEGKVPLAAYFTKYVRDKLPAKPVSTRKDHVQIYIQLVEIYRDALEEVEGASDIKNIRNILERISNERGFRYLRVKPYYTAYKAVNMYDYEIERMQSEVDLQDFPNDFKGALKGAFIYERNGLYRIAKGNRYLTNEQFSSYGDALEHAKEVLIPELTKTKERQTKTKQVVRPQLEGITRTGKDVRKGKDITGEDILENFKFRGGEFGNWNTQDDRQAFLNYSYESLADLASVLRAKPDFISLGGYKDKKLAIAFGARGKGSAMAHYEPKNVVINLTKMRGAGSLAHEWAHALDDFLGVKCTNTSLLSSIHKSYKLPKMDTEHDDIIAAFTDLMETIKSRKATDEEMIVRRKENDKRTVTNIEGWLRGVEDFYQGTVTQSTEVRLAKEKFLEELTKESYESFVSIYKDVTGRLPRKEVRDGVENNLRFLLINKENLEKMIKSKDFGDRFEVHTDFYSQAIDLDKGRVKPYFATEVELFARAFEGYVEDVITNRGNKSQYLVHSTYNKYYEGLSPYPQGEERKLINQKMKEFLLLVVDRFSELQTEEEIIETVTQVAEDKEERSKFKLTHFKELNREKGLKVDFSKTPVKNIEGVDKYIIGYTAGVVKEVEVNIFNDIEKRYHNAIIRLDNSTHNYNWEYELPYENFVEFINTIVKREEAEAEEKEKQDAVISKSGDVLEKDLKDEETQSPTELDKEERIKLAEEMRLLLKDKGLRLIIDDVRGTLQLHHGTSQTKARKIKKEGFLPGTTFSHATTKTGYDSEGPNHYAKKVNKNGIILSINVDPRGVTFNETTGEFTAGKGLVFKNSIWIIDPRENNILESKPTVEKVVEVKLQKTPEEEMIERFKAPTVCGVKDYKDLRAVLNDYVTKTGLKLPYGPTFNAMHPVILYNINVKYKANLPILIRSIPDVNLAGKSKAWAYDNQGNLCISSKAEDRKKVEGLIEGVTEGILRGSKFSAIQKSMLREGITHMVCKTLNLDVRSYLMSDGFTKTIKAGDKHIQNYVNTLIDLYVELIKYFR